MSLFPCLSCEEKTTAIGRINHQLVFQSNLILTWPRPITFTGYGFNKKNAEASAVIKAAEMLYKGAGSWDVALALVLLVFLGHVS